MGGAGAVLLTAGLVAVAAAVHSLHLTLDREGDVTR